MRKYFPDILVIFLLFVISALMLRSLFLPGLPMLHDSGAHIGRMIAYKEALMDGQFPPVWAKNLLGGIGSPVLTVSYQLPYMLTEILTKAGMSIIDSYKFVLGISLVLSGVFMYFALRQKFNYLISFVSSILYILAPYRMVDILVRGAVGEALAFVFIPIVLLGIFRKSFIWLTIGWVGLFLTHPLVSAIFAGFYFLYVLFILEKKERKNLTGKFVLSFFLALMISSFNLLPIAFLTKFTHYSPEQSNPLGHFPTFFQLVSSPWGYGASEEGPIDYMSFSIGFSQLAVILGFIVYLFDRWQIGKKVSKEIIFFAISLVVTFFMLSSVSAPYYRVLELGRFIDFPWRLLLFLVFLISFLAAILLSKIKGKLLVALLIALPLASIFFTIPLTDTHPYYWREKLSYFEYDTGDDKGEYSSKYRNTRLPLVIEKEIEVLSGKANLKVVKSRSNLREYSVEVLEPGVVRMNVSYFPGWELSVDGNPKVIQLSTGINPDEGCFVTAKSEIVQDDSGLIACHLDRGVFELKLRYVPTKPQKIGNILSLVGISIFGIYLFFGYVLKGKIKT